VADSEEAVILLSKRNVKGINSHIIDTDQTGLSHHQLLQRTVDNSVYFMCNKMIYM